MAKRLSADHRRAISRGLRKFHSVQNPGGKQIAGPAPRPAPRPARPSPLKSDKHAANQLAAELLQRDLEISDLKSQRDALIRKLLRAQEKIERMASGLDRPKEGGAAIHADWGHAGSPISRGAEQARRGEE